MRVVFQRVEPDGATRYTEITLNTPGSTVYLQVGARATGDANPPLTTDPNGDDYTYSPVQTVVRP